MDAVPAEHPVWIQEGSTPSAIVATQDLIQEFKNRLTDGERKVADLRLEGLSWGEISERLGETAAALRKRLERARERIAKTLDLE